MKERLTFWRSSVVFAGRWLLSLIDNVGRLLTIIAILGVPVVAALLSGIPRWTAALGLIFVLAAALEEGAFRAWHAGVAKKPREPATVVAYPAGHVDEIKLVAKRCAESVQRGEIGTADKDGTRAAVLRSCFVSHFPQVGRLLDEWDVRAGRRQSAKASLDKLISSVVGLSLDSATVGAWLQAAVMAAAWNSVANAVASEPSLLLRLEWWCTGGQLHIALPGQVPSIAPVASIPGERDAQVRLLDSLSDALVRIAEGPESRDLRQTDKQLASTRPDLTRQLTVISMAHDLPPGSTCELCRGFRPSLGVGSTAEAPSA